MTTVSKKRRRDLALRADTRADFQLLVWFGYYSRDDDFCTGLEALAQEHHDILPLAMDDGWYREYRSQDVEDSRVEQFIAGVEKFARKWSLDRLIDGRGVSALWLWMKARRLNSAWPARYFGNSTPPRHVNATRPDIQRNDQGVPVLEFGSGLWDPHAELISDARERLEQESKQRIAAELDRIATAFEAADWTKKDTKTEAHKYPGWAYRRWIHQEECEDIAASEPAEKRPAARTVQDRTNEFAHEIGFNFPKTRRRASS